MTSDTPLPPGSTIGILGGGQLGRLLAIAAAELGFSVHIFAPAGDNPAIGVAEAATVADWLDETALAVFANAVDVVTYEFENIPEETVRRLAEMVSVYPGVNALAIAQDRLAEKTMATSLGLGVAPYAPIDSAADLAAAAVKLTLPAILKSRWLGYDGKGQVLIERPEDTDEAWRIVGAVPAVVESRVAFRTEISVILARGSNGETRAFDIPENRHERGILSTSTVPAAVPVVIGERAIAIAEQIAAALDYVGVLAVELFVVGEGDSAELLVNEIAPRVHNSGHWTSDACLVSQFEMHIRAIAGWPLPDPIRHSDVTMTNLIGADVEGWPELAAERGARLYLYGKSIVRPGRKMGHLNRVTPRRN